MLRPIERSLSYIYNINSNYLPHVMIGLALLIHLFCMATANLLVEETYYWNYSQHLDFSYLDHPPMVALLIKLTTTLLGTNEFAVRAGGLLCWVIMTYFSYALSELIHKGCGVLSVLLISILPFFFLQSFFLTPDMPLLACWSALLYCLYRALVRKRLRFGMQQAYV
jgi:4-amino-4-deoxy-L-arabinose transferase-like glycosyltransferase